MKDNNGALLVVGIICLFIGFLLGSQPDKYQGKTAEDWYNTYQQSIYCHGYTLGEDITSFTNCLDLDFQSQVAPYLAK